jgi:hypothetical protein
MTSKAAKRAYLKANRAPRISRAEQRRLEAEERARQKEEDEKERNAERAKAARERKAQKEQAQRDARRKMGVPEPSKFVRPSQPTISRFVVAGAKRTWQAVETVADESDSTICGGEDDNYQPAKRLAADDTSEEEFGDFPSLSQSDLPALLDNIDNATEALKDSREEGSQELPQRRANADKEKCIRDEQDIDDMITAQLLSEAAEASSRYDDALSPRKLSGTSNNIRISVDEENTKREDAIDSARKTVQDNSRQALAGRPMNVPPPARVVKAISFAPTPPKPRRSAPAADEGNDPPSATQVFLEDHLDDFFPSPSQEIRELLENANDLLSNTQIIQELNPGKPVDEDLAAGMFLSQDFVLSSQDLLEINTPSRAPPGRDGGSVPAQIQAAPKVKRRFFEEKEDDLLQAAIHESKLEAERERRQKEPPKKTSGQTKRTLQRIHSAATDYGDEEFSAYEEELLAML